MDIITVKKGDTILLEGVNFLSTTETTMPKLKKRGKVGRQERALQRLVRQRDVLLQVLERNKKLAKQDGRNIEEYVKTKLKELKRIDTEIKILSSKLNNYGHQ